MMSPQFKKSFESGIFGNFLSLGGDQVKPPDFVFMFINGMMIVPPTLYVVAYTNIRLLGWGWGLAYDVVLLLSMFNLIRLIYKTGYTEPGIVPSIPTPELDYGKNLVVEYKPESTRRYAGNDVEHFFS